MNKQDLQEQLKVAANKFTESVVAIFGDALKNIAQDIGTLEAAPAKRVKVAAPPAAPKGKPAKAAKPVAPAKPVKAAKPAPAKPAPKPAPAKPAPKPAPAKPAPKPAAKPAPKPSKADRLARRSEVEIEKAGEAVVKLLSQSGERLRIEQINARLGSSTKELMRPIKKLLSKKRIKKDGDRRATLYYV